MVFSGFVGTLTPTRRMETAKDRRLHAPVFDVSREGQDACRVQTGSATLVGVVLPTALRSAGRMRVPHSSICFSMVF